MSDRVPADNLYRKLKETLDLQFLYAAMAKYYGKDGQKSIDPIVFFKLLLVGYLENQPSDRRIIGIASVRLDILYFIGYDVDEELPWNYLLNACCPPEYYCLVHLNVIVGSRQCIFPAAT